MSRRLGLVSVLLLLPVAACSGGDDGDSDASGIDGDGETMADVPDGNADDGGAGPGCGFDPTGTGGAVTVSAGSPATVVEKNGTAMNQMPTGIHPLPEGSSGLLRHGPCGDVGLLYRDALPGGGGGRRCASTSRAASGWRIVEPALPGFGLHALPALRREVLAVVILHTTVLGEPRQYERAGDGTWSSSVMDDLLAALGGAPSMLGIVSATTSADGTWLAVVSAAAAGTEHVVHARRAPAAGSAWTFTVLPAPEAGDVQAWAAAADGSVHAVYTNTAYPCDPCNMDLYYGRVAAGGSWTTETVQPGRWGDPNDEFAADASLAVDEAGAPWIAATFQTRVITGSLIGSELRFYGKIGGTWCHETVADHSDGYAGDDGAVFTGVTPQLALDGAGRFHVVFGDLSQWHDGLGQANGVPGQARYAVRAGTAWHLATVFEQPGRTESAQPLHAFDSPILAVSPDGADVRAAGVERIWDTDSIYNMEDKTVTLRLRAIDVEVDLP